MSTRKQRALSRLLDDPAIAEWFDDSKSFLKPDWFDIMLKERGITREEFQRQIEETNHFLGLFP